MAKPVPAPSPTPAESAEETPPDQLAEYLAERGYANEQECFEALDRRHERARAVAERTGRLAPERSQFAPERSQFAGQAAALAS